MRYAGEVRVANESEVAWGNGMKPRMYVAPQFAEREGVTLTLGGLFGVGLGGRRASTEQVKEAEAFSEALREGFSGFPSLI